MKRKKRRRPARDPYLEVLQKFNQQGVPYIVVGMAGINFYARDARESFVTMNYDILLESSRKNVTKAVWILEGLGFSLSTSEGPFSLSGLKEVVADQRTLTATTSEGLMVELLLAVTGYPFSELARDAQTFTVEGVPVKVGQLKKLLHSKQLAGRSKDREFLKRYLALRKEK